MAKNFLEVFPTLNIAESLKELLGLAQVEKVTTTRDRSSIRIYLKSPRLIHKQNIYDLEKGIKDQLFPDKQVSIKIQEKYRLSDQYTPQKLLDMYKESLLLELKNYSIIEYTMFRKAEINFDNIPNLANIDPKFLEMSREFDPENLYSVPYTWGTVGILYNTKTIEERGLPVPKKWSDLWNPAYKGEILMQDSVRDAFMVALKARGYSMNTENINELQEAKADLIAQKPLVQAYVIDQVRDKMIGGEAALGVIFSGEMLYIQEEVENQNLDYSLEYVIPEEGTNLWIDSWVIPADAKNKENAEKWINFLCRPDIALKNFEYITYATPNKAAKELLDEDMQNNKAVFPDMDQLENCEVYRYLGDETDAVYNNLWKEVKSN